MKKKYYETITMNINLTTYICSRFLFFNKGKIILIYTVNQFFFDNELDWILDTDTVEKKLHKNVIIVIGYDIFFVK